MNARWYGAVMVIAASAALVACSTTTSGQGQGPVTSASSSSTHDFPSSTSSNTAPSNSGSATTGVVTPSVTATSPKATAQQREERLTAQTNGRPHRSVGVPGGVEAAVWDEAGNISFWRSSGTSINWIEVGASRYPNEVHSPPYEVAVSGALLTAMAHPTFLVLGQFTTDNSGLVVAFTAGAKGWGAIKAEANGNIGPSGAPVGADRIGLSRGFGFSAGDLVTKDCPQNRPISQCGGHEVVKRWRWTGSDFKQA